MIGILYIKNILSSLGGESYEQILKKNEKSHEV